MRAQGQKQGTRTNRRVPLSGVVPVNPSTRSGVVIGRNSTATDLGLGFHLGSCSTHSGVVIGSNSTATDLGLGFHLRFFLFGIHRIQGTGVVVLLWLLPLSS